MVHFREARVEALGRIQCETTSLDHRSQHLNAPHKSHHHSIEEEMDLGRVNHVMTKFG
jgi:hypothetical protein